MNQFPVFFKRRLTEPFSLFEGWPKDFQLEEGSRHLKPAVDVHEGKTHFFVRADISGVDPEDMEISVTDGRFLSISGEKKAVVETDIEGSCHYRERCFGAFSRTLTLPSDVDSDKIEATYKDGVLKIQLPKTEQQLPKKIPIQRS